MLAEFSVFIRRETLVNLSIMDETCEDSSENKAIGVKKKKKDKKDSTALNTKTAVFYSETG